ncbi:ATPase-like protein [Leptomonas pyrrhocoris]|uniref:ATPase-like protein n=1 Tax=Leptomonas pyrrhocoris TaxID=157538 RepID=A0A0N0DX08_LEPPY|nr:ATPase-like protein [Leptomonas pyrrhocoris]KPA82428.1 ATPase-like protein [Leptomonas pyrrhocoris]|eukprot:XP_015660867.1 ATPase-like protein [Leptomonas pyrrhocoris]
MMEAKKIEETRTLVQQANSVLLEHLKQTPRTSLSQSERRRLRELLRSLLPSLSIVRSFEHLHRFRSVYVTVENAVEQVLTCPALSETETPPDDGTRPTGETANASLFSEAAQLAAPTPRAAPTHPADAEADAAPMWKNFYGCQEAILALRQATTLPLRYPTLFTGPRRPWRRLLLYGPPGTGKTQLAAATATEFNAVFLSVSAADLLSKWVGESEKQVRHAFAQAAAAGPRCILFFDEVDALCGARGGQGESEVARRLKTEFLLHLQNVAATVVVLAATNLPWELDAAIVRRFDRFVHVGLPSLEDKLQFLRDGMRGAANTVTDAQLRRVAEQTKGFSLVDLRRLLSDAVMAPVTEWLSGRSSFQCKTTDGNAVQNGRAASEEKCGGGALLPANETSLSSTLPCRVHCGGEEVDDDRANGEQRVLGDASSGSETSANAGFTTSSACTSANGTQSPVDASLAEILSTTSDASLDRACEFDVPSVEVKHFEEALRRVVATTPAADAARYSSWSSHVVQS